MNRRIPTKKNYFSLLSDLSESSTIRYGSYMVAGSAVIFLSWFIFNQLVMDASTLLGIISLVAIPLIVLVSVFIGLEKMTGISCLRGVEWVGKKTLWLLDQLVLNFKQMCGINTTSVDTGTPLADKDHGRTDLANKHTTEAAVPQERPATPVLDFAAIEVEDPTQESLQYRQQLFAENSIDDDELDLEIVQELTELDNIDLEHPMPSTAGLSDAIHSQPLSDVINNQMTDIQTDIGVDEGSVVVNNVVEFPVSEQSIQADSTPSMSILTDQIDNVVSLNNADIKALDALEEQQGVGGEDVLSAMVTELDADEVELELKSLFQETDGLQGVEENKASIENSLFKLHGVVDDEQNVPENSVDLKVNSSTEQAGIHFLDTESREDVTHNPGEIPGITEVENTQTDSSVDYSNRAVEESQNVPLYASMLSNAEQTASSLLSSFSEKLAKSFHFQEEPGYHLPSIDLLQLHQRSVRAYSSDKLDEMSRSVERVLKDYKVIAEVVGAYPGPIITRFEISLAPGVKVSRVSGLAKDLARAMLVTSVRVVEIIKGTPYIGLEIPNEDRELVSFHEIVASEIFQQAASPITLALGKDVAGQTVVSDLAKMPHLLVAGTTGSGKSVAINTMILSMLYKATPEQVRMIMIDPKMLELSVYEGIPHLLTPVVTDMKEAQNALRWAVAEMERRYKLMSKVGVRNLAGFNQKIEAATARGETIRDPLFQLLEPLEEGEKFPLLSTLPSIVIIIDELADMMMIVGKKVEEPIARLAQKARAAGIHLILATQRPSVDVLTGLIKANVPTRISFQVSSRIDSRTILDQGGAEALLGNGDMLFLPSGTSVPTRSHGAFVDDDEVHAVVDYLKTQGAANYLTEIIQEEAAETAVNTDSAEEEDELYQDAISFVMETGRASISSVQRRFKVGYNRAARMIDKMEEEHIVSEPEGNGSRRVLNREE